MIDAKAPAIVYPSNQTRFPRNIYRTLFQWKTQGMHAVPPLVHGAGTAVTVYTDGKHATARERRRGLLGGGRGVLVPHRVGNAGQTVHVDGRRPRRVDAAADGAPLGGHHDRVLEAGRQGRHLLLVDDVGGHPARQHRAPRARGLHHGKPSTTYTNPADAVKCVACHVVSRDGKYMVAPVEAMSGKSLWVMEVTKDAPPNPLVKQIANTDGHGFATISPDDATSSRPSAGKMWMVDRATGAFGANLPLGGLKGTHPDWSPDNKQVVFATGEGDAPGGASLARHPVPERAARGARPRSIVDPP